MSRLPLLAAIAALVGCGAGRDYRQPPVPTPTAWTTPTPDGDAQGQRPWWTVFADPELERLIDLALADNRDLAQAGARLREARAARGVAAGYLWPTVDGQGGVTRSDASDSRGGSALGARTIHALGLDASWEIDLFGGVRRGIEASDADLAAAAADRDAVALAVTTEVARAWLDLCAYGERIALGNRGVADAEESLALVRARAAAGLDSVLAVSQADAVAAQTAAGVATLEAARAQVRNRLGVLIGTTPDAVATLMPSVIPVPIAGLAMVAPADLVRRRPDLRLRERQVAAAVARSGIAEAELYPRLSLSGSFAYESTRTSGLFDSASRAWSIGPSIRVPLFNRGRLKQQVAVQDARAEQAVAAYEQAALQAYADVENALASLARQGERAAQLDRQVAALASALELAEQRHQEGLDGYLAVIDARTRLVDARDVRAQARLDAARQLVALAAALGGGWEAPAARP